LHCISDIEGTVTRRGYVTRLATAGIIISFAAIAATPRFEAAEVHRSASATNPQSYRSGGFLRGERYDLRKVTMIDLIRLAYGFEPDDVFGGPDWLALTRFDIAAKAGPSTSPQDLRLMLQSLLADRFALVLHKDVRPVPAFALKLGRDKPKIKKAEGSGEAECKYLRQPGGSVYTVYACRNMTMAGFAQQLRGMAGDYLADPVVDETGLTVAWDFDLQWNGRSRILPAGAERITIFRAIDQQLGLRLTTEKVPGDVIVIDSVNEKPTDNTPGVGELLPPREVQFEVASVKPSRPDVNDGFSGATAGGGFEARGETLRNLFATAWDVHWDHVDEMIAGMPKWMDSARYDIVAKPAAVSKGPPPPRSSAVDDDLRLMLRALLTERFKIRAHYENRLFDAYRLVAGSPRLKKADPASRANCSEAHTVENDPRDLNPRLSRLLACRNITTTQFAEQLLVVSPNDFAYAVVDETGISGRWDFMLSYTPTGDSRNPVKEQGEPSGALSIFEAVRRQLGLRLELQKRMLPVLVIDHIEEKPVEN
jgi:uncharacterized protein (TIGR03435 family)